MHSDPVTIYCPNPLCQAPNPESHRFCYQCRSALPKRYLWAVGEGLVGSLASGALLANRYLLKQDRILLDTKPGLLPDLPDGVPVHLEPYLKLSTHRLHIPQVYGLVRIHPRRGSVLLLEQAPIYPEGAVGTASADTAAGLSGAPLEGHLMPALLDCWKESQALRQLNWLWQIAHLWQPLSLNGAVSTLLEPHLIRVEGGLVRLLELRLDGHKAPSLVDLGTLWQQWQAVAQPEIADFLAQLCHQMQQKQLRNGEQLIAALDRGLAVCGRNLVYHLRIATQMDQGPSRQRNEDACYPSNGTVIEIGNPAQGRSPHPTDSSLVMVCDGIGGHEGGDVASNMAIATLHQKLSQEPLGHSLDPQILIARLEQATFAANDRISQRNDNEHRQERQRMGTTLVMALVKDHELYLTHVGDSRAYRITRAGCHQVTLDDDLASREVRLGYATYREALQQPGAGSLVQALGMGASSLLHPTVQRFVLDDDCLFLLCSDGLSDNDRVEEHWQTELLPVLEGTIDLATASQRLVAIANTLNGHDNVTVGLVYCQTSSHPPAHLPEPLDASLAIAPSGPDISIPSGQRAYAAAPLTPTPLPKTQVLVRPRSRSVISWFVTAALGLVAVGLLALLLLPVLRPAANPPIGDRPNLPDPATPEPEASFSPSPPAPISVGSLVQINRSKPGETGQLEPILLLPQPRGLPSSTPSKAIAKEIPLGTVLQIVRRQAIPNYGNWLKLKVCSAQASAPASKTMQAGELGWIEEDVISPLVTQNLELTAPQLGKCAASPSAVASPSGLEKGSDKSE